MSDPEGALLDRITNGTSLDLAEDDDVSFDEMASWSSHRTIRAEVLRDLIIRYTGANFDPRGIRIRGARVAGRLDLQDLATAIPLSLTECYFPNGIDARRANLSLLQLTRCFLEHSSEPALDCEDLTAKTLKLVDTKAGVRSKHGTIRLSGAHVSGTIDARGVQLTNGYGPAINASGVHVGGDLLLEGACATGRGDDGAVWLPGAHIAGTLDASGACMRNYIGPALNAFGAQVGGDLSLLKGFEAIGSGEDGAIRLRGAHVGGTLDASQARLTNKSGPALHASAITVDRGVFLRDGFAATGNSKKFATIVLTEARVAGGLEMQEANLTNSNGPALAARRMSLEGDLFLASCNATGSGASGAVRLLGASITGRLDASGAVLVNADGPALYADGMLVGGALNLGDGFKGVGLSPQHGAVCLAGAHITGPIRVNIGAISVPTGQPGIVDVEGFTYSGLPMEPSVSDWLQVLRDRTPRYAAQPYRHLAAAAQAAGHDREARQILMSQREDQLKRASARWFDRLWGGLTRVTLGYGYQPWRALLFLVGVIVLACALTSIGGSRGGLGHPPTDSVPGHACTVLERVAAGLELSIPILETEADGDCAPTDTHWGKRIIIGGWLLQLAAWSLATLFIAGFTGAVRKT